MVLLVFIYEPIFTDAVVSSTWPESSSCVTIAGVHCAAIEGGSLNVLRY